MFQLLVLTVIIIALINLGLVYSINSNAEWNPSPLEPQFWLPSKLIESFRVVDLPSEPCSQVDKAIVIDGEFGRLNNYLIELVHMLEVAVLSDPPKALILTSHYYEMTHNHLDLVNITKAFACVMKEHDERASRLTQIKIDAKAIYKQKEIPLSSFRGQVMAHLFLNPSMEIRQRVSEFERLHGLSGGYNAAHFRGLEGQCMNAMRRRYRNRYTYAVELGRNITEEDICELNFDYLQYKMRQGFTSHLPLLIAHDDQNRKRLSELVQHFHAVERTGLSPVDVIVDTLLLIRADTFIPNLVSTLSDNVLHIRSVLTASSLYIT